MPNTALEQMNPPTMDSESEIHVMAAAVFDSAGRVLVARRHDDAHQGGLWEFPGGKLEPGEGRLEGLRRELREEVGIEIAQARPLIRVRHHYGDRAVLLDVWRVDAFRGEPHGREGQPLQWLHADQLPTLDMPAADRPIVNAVRLADHYMITGEFRDLADFQQRLHRALEHGVRFVQLRLKNGSESQQRTYAQQARELCERHGAFLLVNADAHFATQVGAAGVHLSSDRLLACDTRPLPASYWVAASCHDQRELTHAESIGADFAVLSPVAATPSHPDAKPLGWERTQALLDAANIPVFLLGGMEPRHMQQAWDAGAQGVASIRAYWGAKQ